MSLDIDTIIQESLDFMQKAADGLITNYSAAGEDVVNSVMKLLSDYSTKGKLDVTSSERIKILNRVSDAIIRGFKTSNVPTYVNEYIRSFDRMAQNTHRIQNILNGIDIPNSLTEPLIKTYADKTRTLLLNTGVSIELDEPIKSIILANLTGGASLANAEQSLRAYIVSNAESIGRLEAMSGQVARDLIFQLNGNIDAEIAKEFELNAIRYVGSLKPGVHRKLKNGKRSKSLTNESRPQCVRWVGQSIILLSDLQDELNWAYKNGSGMIKGTTVDNFTVYRGGYNCRHAAIPFKK